MVITKCESKMAASSSSTIPVENNCKRSRKCSKLLGHKGLCNSERKLDSFWEKSPVYQQHKRKRELLNEEDRVAQEIRDCQTTTSRLRAQIEQLAKDKSELEIKLNERGKLSLLRLDF